MLAGRDLVARDFPADLAPPDATGAAAGRVLAAPVRRGEVLTDVRLVGPALADAVPGETVLPVRLPDAGMATLLRAGDEVDLVATDPGTGDTTVVARDVTVLATPTGRARRARRAARAGRSWWSARRATEAIAIAGAALAQFLTVSWNR